MIDDIKQIVKLLEDIEKIKNFEFYNLSSQKQPLISYEGYFKSINEIKLVAINTKYNYLADAASNIETIHNNMHNYISNYDENRYKMFKCFAKMLNLIDEVQYKAKNLERKNDKIFKYVLRNRTSYKLVKIS